MSNVAGFGFGFNSCCCDEDEPEPEPLDCADGVGCVDCWEVAVAGVVNNTCPSCTVFNGVHVLDHRIGCTWRDLSVGTITGCGVFSGLAVVTLTINEATQTARLLFDTLGGGAITEYRGPIVNCEDAVTLTRTFAHPMCSGWPATLTVSAC